MFRTFGLVIILSTTLTASRADDAAWGEVGGADLPATEQMSSEQLAAPSANEPACGKDDPRLENIIPVLKEIQAGNTIKPVQLSLETYMGLSPKVLGILGGNLYISVPDCSKHFLFEGEFIEKMEVPMSSLWYIINNTLRSNSADKLQFINKNLIAAPMTASEIIHYLQYITLPSAQHSLLKDVLLLIPMKDRSSKNKEGWLLLDIYVQLGGRLVPEDVGKNIYIVDSFSDPTGVYLDNGDGNNTITKRLSIRVINDILSLLGLITVIPDSLSQAKNSSWYQKFVELNFH